MPDPERTPPEQDKRTSVNSSNEILGVLSHGIFLSKFYDDYSNYELTQDPFLSLSERITNFQTYFSSWKEDSLIKFGDIHSPENTSAFNIVNSLSLKSTESFAHNKHMLFKTKSLSEQYSISERLEYSDKADKWASRLNLAFWADDQQTKQENLKSNVE